MHSPRDDRDIPTELFTPSGYAQLLASPRGRAIHLSFMAHAEEDDEGAFDRLLERVDAPDLHRMIEIHATDERRHARLLRTCVERLGFPLEPVPEELRYIERIRRLAGAGTTDTLFAADPLGIMNLFAMLRVVEERGVRQFPMVAEAMRAVDPESASVVTDIVRDEQRHVRYADAISRRYAPDPSTLAQALELCRALEARAFAENQQAYLRFAIGHGLLADAPPEGADSAR